MRIEYRVGRPTRNAMFATVIAPGKSRTGFADDEADVFIRDDVRPWLRRKAMPTILIHIDDDGVLASIFGEAAITVVEQQVWSRCGWKNVCVRGRPCDLVCHRRRLAAAALEIRQSLANDHDGAALYEDLVLLQNVVGIDCLDAASYVHRRLRLLRRLLDEKLQFLSRFRL